MGKLQKFYFQAVDQDNKRISGSIFSEDEEAAKIKIKNKNLALFSIEKFDENKSQQEKTGLNNFEFEGINPDGKNVRGKIEAIDAYEGYKKLRKDYEFEVTSIVDSKLDFEEKGKIISKGIPDEFKELYQTESFAFKKKKKKKKIEIVEISEKDKQELAFYSYEISLISKEIHRLLEKSNKYLNKEERQNILNQLGLIERLRQSNAVGHLKKLTNRLIDELADAKLFMEEKLLSAEEKSEINNLKNEFKTYSKSKKESLVSKALEINLSFDLDARKLAVSISKAKLATKIGLILYWMIVSLFFLMAIFWIKNSINIFILEKNIPETLYILKSVLLWLMTAVSLLNMMIFAPMVFSSKTFKFKKIIVFFGIALISNTLIILLLPSLF